MIEPRGTILVVDDEPRIRKVLVDILERGGFTALEADDGETALQLLGLLAPTVVLLDVRMPGITGLELCRQITREPRFADVPVLFITGNDSPEDIAKGYEAGAVDYIPKPFTEVQVLERVRVYARLHATLVARRQRELQFEAVAKATHDGIVIISAEGQIVFWNTAAEEIFGYPAAEVLGRPLEGLLSSDSDEARDVLGWLVNPIARGGQTLELDARRKDESLVPVELSLAATTDGGQSKAVAIVRDISARKAAEEQLKRTERELSDILESLADGIVVVDTKRQVPIFANRGMRDLLGYEADELLELQFPEFHPEEAVDQVTAIFEGFARGEISHVDDVPMRRKDGSIFYADVAGSLVEVHEQTRLMASFRDATPRRELEDERTQLAAQQVQAQKLEAIGQLAAGIAHEINTPTQYVSDNTTFLQRGFGMMLGAVGGLGALLDATKKGTVDDALVAKVEKAVKRAKVPYLAKEIPNAIGQAMEGIQRIAKIVAAMKEFSHPSGGELQALDLHRGIENTITVARNEWKYVADIETHFDSAVPMINGLADELNQVFLNTIVNAAHAINDVTGGEGKGKITISTALAGEHVEVRVADTGRGVPEELRHRIFDPFFTTKEVGKGTGQGLALAHSVIVNKHGGTLEVEEAPGGGAMFVIRLPIAGPPAEAQDVAA